MIVVHVTHEAVEQIGGIGAVIAGLVTSDAYAERVTRTILLGPLLSGEAPANRRLGRGGKVKYSSLDSLTPPQWRSKFGPIERQHDVNIVYGVHPVTDSCTGKSIETEVLLVDVFRANHDRLNRFKAALYEMFSVPSDRFQDVWDFEQYVRLAEPGFEAVRAIAADDDQQMIVISHEYMGVPTALKAAMHGDRNTRTVFYAHEVASVRPVVETSPGHDTMFHNVLDQALGLGVTLEDVFPSVKDNYKHPLVKAARYCDSVFAVGDRIVSELQFLEKHFRTMHIDLVYNGIPAFALGIEQKRQSRARMQEYAESLFGFRPTWIFTHVARPVLSKGIWRDLGVLHHMEAHLAQRGETAIYFMLGTLAGQRRSQDIRQMERVYGWPVAHEKGYPDLCGGEEVLCEMFDAFNKDRKAVRAVLVNQWDWNHKACGDRMSEEMTFADIRQGTDVEFGLSVYEPFGISQLEPLGAGAICVVSNVCGCVALLQKCTGGDLPANILLGDFIHAPASSSPDDAMRIDLAERDAVETAEGKRLARRLAERLPKSETD
ncbi:MAG: hypothetical protein KAU28_10000, partial [Phycisphaerae bacterium]|nr:hypothetical protein [Phycisphaerae bacterium]